MEIKILDEDENKLFNRKELRFEIIHEGEPTPKLNDVKRLLAQKTNSMINHVLIDKIETLYGIGRTIGNARIYKNKDDLFAYEPRYLLKRNDLVEDKKEGSETKESEEKKE